MIPNHCLSIRPLTEGCYGQACARCDDARSGLLLADHHARPGRENDGAKQLWRDSGRRHRIDRSASSRIATLSAASWVKAEPDGRYGRVDMTSSVVDRSADASIDEVLWITGRPTRSSGRRWWTRTGAAPASSPRPTSSPSNRRTSPRRCSGGLRDTGNPSAEARRAT